MKMNRFALLALVGGLLASALVMGCGSKSEDDTASNSSNATNGAPLGGKSVSNKADTP